MKIQTNKIAMTTNKYLYWMKIISLFTLVLATSTSSENTKCPFHYIYHFGDGYTDIGNSVRILPWGPSLPPTRLPYGKTFPGRPTGRWSDGLVDIDLGAPDLGLPNITPYLAVNKSKSYDGVIFSVARSPVLDPQFFTSRGIYVPPYVVSLKNQVKWFKSYLESVCSKPTTDCDYILQSVVLFGDLEGNDIGYPLSQGKSIQEIKSYVPYVIRESIEAAREVLKMGATRVAIPGNIPVGCYPYILTALGSSSPAAYDDLGCLKSVNNFVLSRNKELEQAVKNLSMEFPSARVFYADLYSLIHTIINQTASSGMNPLKACCGIGGKYNFDQKRFCGSPGVPACSNPNQSIYWDGIHLTQEAYARSERIGLQLLLPALNCTSP